MPDGRISPSWASGGVVFVVVVVIVACGMELKDRQDPRGGLRMVHSATPGISVVAYLNSCASPDGPGRRTDWSRASPDADGVVHEALAPRGTSPTATRGSCGVQKGLGARPRRAGEKREKKGARQQRLGEKRTTAGKDSSSGCCLQPPSPSRHRLVWGPHGTLHCGYAGPRAQSCYQSKRIAA